MAERSYSDVMKAATDALVSGRDIESAVYGKSSSSVPPSNSIEADPSKEASIPSQEAEAGSEEVSKDPNVIAGEATPDIEEVIFSDDEGKKKFKIDWKNREQIKKQVQLAAGARKWQAERDKALNELKEFRPKFEEYKGLWDKVESAYSKDGYEGLINLVSGDPEGYKKLIQQEYSKLRMREEASPAELEKLNLSEQLEKERRERQLLIKERADYQKKLEADMEAADQMKLESMTHPAFDKWRFSGKLGDATVENQLDESVWNQALRRLEAKVESGVVLTNALVDQTFREVSSVFRNAIQKQADKKTTQNLQSKKLAAQEAVASKVVKATSSRSSAEREEFDKQIKSGNLKDSLLSVLTGKVRL